MPQFLIAYDEHKPDYDYTELHEKLRTIGAKHVQESVWAVERPQTSDKLFNTIRPCLPEGAALLVVEIGPDATSVGDLESWKDIF